MSEFATKEDFGRLQSEVFEQRKVTQDLITEVAKSGQKMDSFLEFQTGLNEQLRKTIKEANEATCLKIKDLKEDHTARLNGHSAELKNNAEDRHTIKQDVAKVKEKNKGDSRVVSWIISGIGVIIATVLSVYLTQTLKADTKHVKDQKVVDNQE